MLSLEELNDALTELGRRAYARDKVVEIAIYGGSALMLASNFRVTTQDVDAIADTDQNLINGLAQEIGAERGLPPCSIPRREYQAVLSWPRRPLGRAPNPITE